MVVCSRDLEGRSKSLFLKRNRQGTYNTFIQEMCSNGEEHHVKFTFSITFSISFSWVSSFGSGRLGHAIKTNYINVWNVDPDIC